MYSYIFVYQQNLTTILVLHYKKRLPLDFISQNTVAYINVISKGTFEQGLLTVILHYNRVQQIGAKNEDSLYNSLDCTSSSSFRGY